MEQDAVKPLRLSHRSYQISLLANQWFLSAVIVIAFAAHILMVQPYRVNRAAILCWC